MTLYSEKNILQSAFSLSCPVPRTVALGDSVGVAGSSSPVLGKLGRQEAELPCPLQAGRRDGSGGPAPCCLCSPSSGHGERPPSLGPAEGRFGRCWVQRPVGLKGICIWERCGTLSASQWGRSSRRAVVEVQAGRDGCRGEGTERIWLNEQLTCLSSIRLSNLGRTLSHHLPTQRHELTGWLFCSGFVILLRSALFSIA